MSVSKVKDFTVRTAFIRLLIGLEISCWFFIGECIGKGSLIGYQTAPMSDVLGNFKLERNSVENTGSENSPPGDDKDMPKVTRRTNEEAKKENTDAYNKVGENAKNFVGDSRIARANMKYLVHFCLSTKRNFSPIHL